MPELLTQQVGLIRADVDVDLQRPKTVRNHSMSGRHAPMSKGGVVWQLPGCRGWLNP